MSVAVNVLAADIHRRMVEDDRFGYSWAERYGAVQEDWEVDGLPITIRVGDYDCSSSTITAWKLALEKIDVNLTGTIYTGDMRRAFLKTGLFTWRTDFANAERGDLFLNEENHVAMCQGNGRLSEFSSNEFGGAYGGVRGDQTGWEAHMTGFYYYPWDGYLHYVGTEEILTPEEQKEEIKMTLEEIKMAIWSFKGAWKDFGGKVRANTKDNNQLLNQAARPWSYKNPALEKDDTYQILRNIRDGVVRLESKLDEAIKKL